MEKLKQSPAELLRNVHVQTIELDCLNRVFKYLSTQDPNKPKEGREKIGATDLMKVLNFLGLKLLKSEVALIIWEVDDDLDDYVSFDEYMTMYKRCISDQTGLEPK